MMMFEALGFKPMSISKDHFSMGIYQLYLFSNITTKDFPLVGKTSTHIYKFFKQSTEEARLCHSHSIFVCPKCVCKCSVSVIIGVKSEL